MGQAIERLNAALDGERWGAAAEALTQLGRAAAGAGGVPRILELVAEQAILLVGGDACAVFTLDAAAQHLLLACGAGLTNCPDFAGPVPIGRGVAGRAVATRTVAVWP